MWRYSRHHHGHAHQHQTHTQLTRLHIASIVRLPAQSTSADQPKLLQPPAATHSNGAGTATTTTSTPAAAALTTPATVPSASSIPSMMSSASLSPSSQAIDAQVTELCLALGVTRHTSFRLVCSHPNTPIPDLAMQANSLAAELSLPVEECALLASKEPRLLTTPREQLSGTLQVLCQVMGGLTRTEASRIVVFSPFLVTVPQEEVQQQFDGLAAALQVGPAELSKLVKQQPYVLTTPIAKVHQHVERLCQVFNLDAGRVIALLSIYPSLSMEDPRRLRIRLAELCQVLQASLTDVLDMLLKFPPLLSVHPEITAARLQRLADDLGVEVHYLKPILMSAPAMFSTPQNLLVEQFHRLLQLPYYQDRSKEEVLALVAANPALLGQHDQQMQ